MLILDGLEIDLLLDQGGNLRPAEIKATVNPGPEDLRNLRRFRDLAGNQALNATFFHLGQTQARIAESALVPWTNVDATVAGWGQ